MFFLDCLGIFLLLSHARIVRGPSFSLHLFSYVLVCLRMLWTGFTPLLFGFVSDTDFEAAHSRSHCA